jgi:multidrug resistance efflux pump
VVRLARANLSTEMGGASMEGPPPTPPASADPSPTEGTTTPPRRKLKRSTRIALAVILILALVAGGLLGTSYFINASKYVSTDNAQIDGDKIYVNAPANGILHDWKATLGTQLQEDQIVGRVKIPQGYLQPLMNVRAPASGTVAQDNGIVGTYVTTGTQLAIAYNLDKIFVTARVDETNVKAVRVGQLVDVYVDAYPNTRFTGLVQEIQGGAAGVFSLFPQSNTSGNYQKVTQYIPVKVAIDKKQGFDLVPGMSVTAYIHKH